ncbi:hypothetical protein Ddc_04750 [Ditylenchus destructor]|nr:hypothetical protein Ddc_04750 [Ditylenchus destructor]
MSLNHLPNNRKMTRPKQDIIDPTTKKPIHVTPKYTPRVDIGTRKFFDTKKLGNRNGLSQDARTANKNNEIRVVKNLIDLNADGSGTKRSTSSSQFSDILNQAITNTAELRSDLPSNLSYNSLKLSGLCNGLAGINFGSKLSTISRHSKTGNLDAGEQLLSQESNAAPKTGTSREMKAAMMENVHLRNAYIRERTRYFSLQNRLLEIKLYQAQSENEQKKRVIKPTTSARNILSIEANRS